MATRQVKLFCSGNGGGSSTVPAAIQKVQLPVGLQSQENFSKEVKEFIKEYTLYNTAAINDLASIIDGKFKEFAIDIKAIKDSMEEKFYEIRDDITMAVSGLGNHLVQLAGRVEEINEVNLNFDNKLKDFENKTEKMNEELVKLQFRDMEFALRLRGLKEYNGENLKKICVEALAGILEEGFEFVSSQIEKIYRVNSWAAKQRQLPRDVVIYFTTRKIRSDIVQASYRNKVQVDGKDLVVLKEIPIKILRDRKDFGFLAKELRNCQIRYRWDIPIGLTVNYEGEKYCINTLDKAEDFYVNVLKAGCLPPLGGGRKMNQEMVQQEINEKKNEMVPKGVDEKQPQIHAEVAMGEKTNMMLFGKKCKKKWKYGKSRNH